MTFLPIVERELREAERRRATRVIRCAAVGISLFFVFTILWDHDLADAWVGQNLFRSVSGSTLVACLLAGILATADSISREKRDGTLGLLFLTPLKTYDVVLGKLAAAALNLFYGLLAVAPILMLSLIFGGVTVGEVARMGLALGCALGLTVCLGLLASALWEKEKDAFGTAIALVILFMAIVPAVEELVREFRPASSVQLILGYASLTGTIFDFTSQAAYQANPARYWITCGINVAWCLLALWLAGWLTTRSCRHDRPERWAKWRAFWLRTQFGSLAQRQRLRRRWLGEHPMRWIYLRERTSVWFAWLPVVIAMVLVIVACFDAKFTREWLTTTQGVLVTGWFLNVMLKFQVTSEAASSFAEARRTGALGLLVSSGLKSEEILTGRWRALVRQFLLPLAILLALEIGGLIYARAHDQWEGRSDKIIGLYAIILVILFVDLLTLPWLGMWIGLKTKSSSRATVSTLFRSLFLPALLTVMLTHRSSEFFGGYLLFGLAAAMQGLFAFSQLHTYFRVLACNPHLRRFPEIIQEHSLEYKPPLGL